MTNYLQRVIPSLDIPFDLWPSGFGKGAWKFLGVMVTTFIIGGLNAVLPILQDHLAKLDPTLIIIFTGTVIGAVKWGITWVTTKRSEFEESETVA